MKLNLRKLTFDDVIISIYADLDSLPVRGNLVDSGDAEQDKEMEDEVLERINRGDVWAWCSVEVRANLKGASAHVSGADYLGGCCYEDEQDFIENSGYYEDMVQRATESLQGFLEQQAAMVAEFVASVEV